MTNSHFSERPVEFYDLPLVDETTILHPEQVILRYRRIGSIDIGSLCYLRRKVTRVRARGSCTKVDITSSGPIRVKRVRDLIKFMSEEFSNSGLRDITLLRRHQEIFRFVNWCDTNGHNEALNNVLIAKIAFRSFVANLRDQVAQNKITITTAAKRQNPTLDVLSKFMNIENLAQGINLLQRSGVAVEPTTVPCENAQAKVISWCKALFGGFTELVLDQKPYPFQLNVPGYLNWPDNGMWVFPVNQWCLSPDQIQNRHTLNSTYPAYNYTNGRLNTIDEIMSIQVDSDLACDISTARRRRLSASQVIAEANNDFRYRARLMAGFLGVNAFFMLFVAETGMSPSQIVELPWDDSLDEQSQKPTIERQGFRTIKYRAGNKNISFEIGTAFMVEFKRFLQLRKHLLNGIKFPYLFLTANRKESWVLKQMPAQLGSRIFLTLNRLDPQLPKVTPREWRAGKQDWAITNTDPVTAARLMQHSEITALRRYSNGSVTTHQNEFGNFFSHVEKVIIGRNEYLPNSIDRAIGVCSFPDHPLAISSNAPIQPDCKGPEGCLFCDKYRVHSDERDTRKLLSCRYCIQKTSHLSDNEEQFQRMYGVVLNRIRFILDEIIRRDCDMVDRVEREVDVEGELDPYWASKLVMLMELELI